MTLFRQCVEEVAPEIKKRLVQLCGTRRVERHDAIVTFVPLYPSILACIEKCQLLDNNANATTKACMFGHSVRNSGYIVAVVVLEYVLAITLPLCKAFSPVHCDISLLCTRLRSV